MEYPGDWYLHIPDKEPIGWIPDRVTYGELLRLVSNRTTRSIDVNDTITGAPLLYDTDGNIWRVPPQLAKPDPTTTHSILASRRNLGRFAGLAAHALDWRDPSGIDPMSYVYDDPNDQRVAYAFSGHWTGRVI